MGVKNDISDDLMGDAYLLTHDIVQNKELKEEHRERLEKICLELLKNFENKKEEMIKEYTDIAEMFSKSNMTAFEILTILWGIGKGMGQSLEEDVIETMLVLHFYIKMKEEKK